MLKAKKRKKKDHMERITDPFEKRIKTIDNKHIRIIVHGLFGVVFVALMVGLVVGIMAGVIGGAIYFIKLVAYSYWTLVPIALIMIYLFGRWLDKEAKQNGNTKDNSDDINDRKPRDRRSKGVQMGKKKKQ
jgi:hypothetical protein